MVIYCSLFMVAEELREYMAELGFRTVGEMVGRAEIYSYVQNKPASGFAFEPKQDD